MDRDFGFPTADTVIVLAFILVAVFAFVQAYQFPSGDTLFPQISAAIIIIGGIILLLIKALPESVAQPIKESGGVLDTDEIADEDRVQESGEIDRMKRYKLIVLTAAYLIGGYLFGLLWATPGFVLLYGVANRQKYTTILVTTILSIVAAYVFMEVLNLRIDEGLLIGVIVHVG
jgi:hypothetical protein